MKYLLIIFLSGISFGLFAQSAQELSQAKNDYKNKEYKKALPIFEQAYISKPNDASYNLWYGVCLLETHTDLNKAEECLKYAVQKNLPDAFLYLGDLYVKQYRVSEAQTLYDRFAKLRPREKGLLTERQEKLDNLERNISRTEDIQIIDSVIVDKKNLLSAYKLSSDIGELIDYQHMFNTPVGDMSTVYMNGTQTKMYFGEESNGNYSLFSMDKLINGEFDNKKKLSTDNFGLSGNLNYPFVMSDGMTIYFSAEDEDGMGGYDIYVTRYNLNNDNYLTPERLNMPFNSTGNDYLMVIDENKGVGWFATDRFQPEDKVCIYTFIPSESVKLIESDDDVYQENRAKISSIKDTQIKGTNYSSLKSLARKESSKKEVKAQDFVFVINDNYVYYTYNDFKSSTARNLFYDANEKRKNLAHTERDLDEKRNEYINASESRKSSLAPLILNLESKESQLKKEIEDLDTRTRNEEIKLLK